MTPTYSPESRQPHNLICARERWLGEAVFRQDGWRHEPPAVVHSSTLALTYDPSPESREPHNLICARERRLGEAVFRQDGWGDDPVCTLGAGVTLIDSFTHHA